MRAPSIPLINKNNDKSWFIHWNHDVPFPLWHKYPRQRIRIKIYDNINRHQGVEREVYAEQRLKIWQYLVANNLYNPFEEELELLNYIEQETKTVTEEIEQISQEISDANRMNYTVKRAMDEFITSRKQRHLNPKSIVSYENICTCLLEGLELAAASDIRIGKLKHIHLSAAINAVAEKRGWNATTINKQVGFLMTVLNWLETEEYILKNPSKNKFIALPEKTVKHQWYDRKLAEQVKNAVLNAGEQSLYRAMQFTYLLCIRSKAELRELKISDIDKDLQRVRFRAELSKNNKEQYRDYCDEFAKVLNDMNLFSYPGHFYIFGAGDGTPNEKQCGHNYFSNQFRKIKDQLKLSESYTIYGWKHTRMVHELMKGTQLTHISHLARHSDFKTTEIYLRDFDINLQRVYDSDDLRF